MEDREENKVYIDLERVPLESEREEIRQRKRRKTGRFISYLLVLLVGVGLGYFAFHKENKPVEEYNAMSHIESVIEKYWLYANDYDDLQGYLEDKALEGMTTFDFDGYTDYMSREEMETFAQSINRDYVGIGVQYANQNDMAVLTKVFIDSPAAKAGLLPGDIIVSVNDVDVDETNAGNLKDYVSGESGTSVNIGILRGNENLSFDIVRAPINNTVYIEENDDYIYMEIDSFGESTASEIEKYLSRYENTYNKLIVDVRNNGGGYQTSIRDCLQLFIGSNVPYLRQKDKDGNEIVDYTNNGKTFTNFKNISIITNGETASAAEVFTLVMKEEYPGVKVVGKTTFGKGVIQTNKSLPDGGILKLTTYYWYSPKGTSIHLEGVKPDYEVDMQDIYYETIPNIGDSIYEVDSASDVTRLSQKALEYLGYEVGRTDGYFDESFEEILNEFKLDNDMPADGLLDKDTYGMIIFRVRYELATNKDKDTQYQKAVEVLYED